MALRGVCFELSTSCPSCESTVPLNRATESVLCDSCRRSIPTPPGFWQTVLSDAIDEALRMGPDEGSNSTMMLGHYGLTIQAMYGHQAPRCSDDCKTHFPDEGLEAGITSGATHLHCPSCGRGHSQRIPPDWFSSVYPRAKLLVREDAIGDAVVAKPATEPTSFFCHSCGGSLPLDGSQRTIHCGYCGNQARIPDDVWVRLHPATEKARWYVVVDVGAGGALMPRDADYFCDLVAFDNGDLIVAYHLDTFHEDEGEAGHPCRIARFNSAGEQLWIQDGIEFASYSRLRLDPYDGNVWLHDADEYWLRLIDVTTGAPLGTIESGDDEDPNQLCLEYQQFSIANAGTVLVSNRRHGLLRFNRAGQRVDLWPGRREKKRRSDYYNIEFGDLRDGCVALPSDARIRVDSAGRVYALADDVSWWAVFSPTGEIEHKARTGVESWVYDLEAWDVDSQGNLLIIFEHSEELRDRHYPNLARLSRAGFEILAGPHAPNNETFIGDSLDHMCALSDGGCVVANRFVEIRRLSATGQLVWRSPGCAEVDAEDGAELNERRKGKRLVQDQGGGFMPAAGGAPVGVPAAAGVAAGAAAFAPATFAPSGEEERVSWFQSFAWVVLLVWASLSVLVMAWIMVMKGTVDAKLPFGIGGEAYTTMLASGIVALVPALVFAIPLSFLPVARRKRTASQAARAGSLGLFFVVFCGVIGAGIAFAMAYLFFDWRM